MLQTSDFYFCDLIDELSHIAQNIFSEKKSNSQKLYKKKFLDLRS